MERLSNRTQLVEKLPQLQNCIKRDPDAYRDEFQMQYRHYQSEWQRFQLASASDVASTGVCASDHFVALVSFLAHIATCYPEDLATLPSELMQLLKEQAPVLEPAVRFSLTQSLILLRNRKLVMPVELFTVFFEMFRCQDKKLRDLMYTHILSDLHRLYTSACPQDVHRELQHFFRLQLEKEGDPALSKIALQVIVEMYRKRHWIDARTVNALATVGCTAKCMRLVTGALRFFLGIDHDIMADEEETKTVKAEQVDVDFHEHSKKTKSRHRKTVKQLVSNRKARQRAALDSQNRPIFPALELLHDAQSIVEKQFKMLKGCNEKFEVKLLMMNYMSQVIGCHQLVFFPFYSLLQRYLNAHQQNVTSILSYFIQSCHEHIPPEELLPIVKVLCTNFVSDRVDSAVISVGLNTLRELFDRVPLVLEEEGMDDLISDLVMYHKHKDKSVMMAGRSVLNMIRERHPSLLHRKYRGKFYSNDAKPLAFGALPSQMGVDGIELLTAAEAEGRFSDGDGWEVVSSDEDEDGEWIDVDSSENEEHEPVLKMDSGDEEDLDTDDEMETEETMPAVAQEDRLDAQRILTPKDFARIEILKKEAYEASKDPKLRSKKGQDKQLAVSKFQISTDALDSYSTKVRQTQEERMISILKGREDFQHRKTGGGTTNREKERHKHFLMLRKSRDVQSKLKLSARQIQHQKNKAVKKVMKRDQKKRRRL